MYTHTYSGVSVIYVSAYTVSVIHVLEKLQILKKFVRFAMPITVIHDFRHCLSVNFMIYDAIPSYTRFLGEILYLRDSLFARHFQEPDPAYK